MSLFNRGLQIEIESFINPQSAIRNPQSNILSNFHFSRTQASHLLEKIALSASSSLLIIDLAM
jgi:hypothetical protein